MHFYKQRRRVMLAGREMAQGALAVGTWGNISCRLPGNLMAITPSGVPYGRIKPRDIVVMDLAGNQVEGCLTPSTEQPLHRAIYTARDDVGAIVHTHSVYATALATARQPIPGVVEDLVQIVGGQVSVADYALPGSPQLGENVVKALANRNGVLLANHGALGVGAKLAAALLVCQIIEKSARVYLAAQTVGGAVPLPQEDIDFMRDYYCNKYGQR